MKMHASRGSLGITGLEVALAVIAVIALASGAYYFGTLQSAPPVIESSTTTVTTTPPTPAQVQLVGGYATTTIGTSAKSISFVSQTTGVSYPGSTSGGQYGALLPNGDTYTVKIHWDSFIDTSGDCTAGTVPLYLQFEPTQPVTASWSC